MRLHYTKFQELHWTIMHEQGYTNEKCEGPDIAWGISVQTIAW